MKFKVHMLAFGRDGEIREVDVPDSEIIGLFRHQGVLESLLGLVFYHGQNDHQPQDHCSVSVGDAIEFPGGEIYLVDRFSFRYLKTEEFKEYKNTPQRDRGLLLLGH